MSKRGGYLCLKAKWTCRGVRKGRNQRGEVERMVKRMEKGEVIGRFRGVGRLRVSETLRPKR